jgi:hypothetical protein
MQLGASRLSAGRASSSGPSLETLALAAIRRNNGSLWGVAASNAGLFTDSAGTTPASAVGDVLGLVTDRAYGSGGLGPNLYTGGDIFGVPIGGPAFTDYPTGVSSVSGKSYEFQVDVSDYVGALTYSIAGPIDVNWSVLNPASGSGKWRFITRAIAGRNIAFFTRSTNSANFRNIQIREVLGSHATQPTTANKPVIAALPNGKRAIAFDASNDALIFGFPSTSLTVRTYTTTGTITTVTSSTSTQFVLGQALMAGRNAVLIIAIPSEAFSPQDSALFDKYAQFLGAVL